MAAETSARKRSASKKDKLSQTSTSPASVVMKIGLDSQRTTSTVESDCFSPMLAGSGEQESSREAQSAARTDDEAAFVMPEIDEDVASEDDATYTSYMSRMSAPFVQFSPSMAPASSVGGGIELQSVFQQVEAQNKPSNIACVSSVNVYAEDDESVSQATVSVSSSYRQATVRSTLHSGSEASVGSGQAGVPSSSQRGKRSFNSRGRVPSSGASLGSAVGGVVTNVPSQISTRGAATRRRSLSRSGRVSSSEQQTSAASVQSAPQAQVQAHSVSPKRPTRSVAESSPRLLAAAEAQRLLQDPNSWSPEHPTLDPRLMEHLSAVMHHLQLQNQQEQKTPEPPSLPKYDPQPLRDPRHQQPLHQQPRPKKDALPRSPVPQSRHDYKVPLGNPSSTRASVTSSSIDGPLNSSLESSMSFDSASLDGGRGEAMEDESLTNVQFSRRRRIPRRPSTDSASLSGDEGATRGGTRKQRKNPFAGILKNHVQADFDMEAELAALAESGHIKAILEREKECAREQMEARLVPASGRAGLSTGDKAIRGSKESKSAEDDARKANPDDTDVAGKSGKKGVLKRLFQRKGSGDGESFGNSSGDDVAVGSGHGRRGTGSGAATAAAHGGGATGNSNNGVLRSGLLRRGSLGRALKHFEFASSSDLNVCPDELQFLPPDSTLPSVSTGAAMRAGGHEITRSPRRQSGGGGRSSWYDIPDANSNFYAEDGQVVRVSK